MGDDLVPLYKNTTITTIPGGWSYPSLERCVLPGTGDCSPCDGECGEDDATGYWPIPYPTNTFEPSGTVNLAVCHKTGWKGVLAKRFWHGTFGPMAEGQADSYDGCGCDPSPPLPESSEWESYKAAPESTKYLTVSISYAFHEELISGSATMDPDQSLSYDLTVDANSGIITPSNFSASPNNGFANWFLTGYIGTLLGVSPAEVTTGIANAIAFIVNTFFATEIACSSSPFITTTLSGTDWTITFDEGSLTIEARRDGDTFTFSSPSNGDNPDYSDSFTYELSDTGMTWTYQTYIIPDVSPSDPSYYVLLDTETVTVTYSNPNLGSKVVTDARNLLQEWDLADDLEYPFRTDPYLTMLPVMCRNENQGNVNPFGYSGGIISDFTNPLDLDGAGIGSPDWETSSCQQIMGGDPNGANFTLPYPITITPDEIGIPITPEQVFDLAATNGGSLSWGGSLPPGLTLDETTATLSGTPTSAGVYGINLYITQTPTYDGAVLGAPLPAGYENYFDFAQRDKRYCCADEGDGSFAVGGCDFVSGQDVGTQNDNSGAQIPLNATKWTNNEDSLLQLPFASVRYGGQVQAQTGCDGIALPPDGIAPSVLTAVKYAEIIDLWPSQNFARPAGADKFIFDESEVYGCYDFDGTTLTPYVWSSNNIQAASSVPDTSGIWGGAAVSGFGTITYNSGTGKITFTRTMNLPTGWASASGDTNYCFGKLRYPNAPAILGRVSIKAVVDSLGHTPGSGSWTPTYQFGGAQPYFGMAIASPTESCDFYDASMNLLATQSCTRVDDLHFTTSTAVVNAVYVMIHGNPAKWYMDDAMPKGDFVTLQWLWDWRNNREYRRLNGMMDCGTQVLEPSGENYGFASFAQTQECLPYNPCSPRVAYFGFDEENFANAAWTQMPTGFVLDERYGSLWQGMPVAMMTDILWQGPHKPFAIGEELTGGFNTPGTYNLSWNEDDGTCRANTFDGETYTAYYAHAPQVECLLSVPSDYGYGRNEAPPSPPGDAESLGFISPATHADGQLPPGPAGLDIAIGANGFPNAVTNGAQWHETFCANAGCEEFDYDYPGCS
ncbi:MAG TPA: Ig domain-containing protein [Verrucomicrobiae bacterium]